MGKLPTRRLIRSADQAYNDNKKGPARKKKRKVRLDIGPLKIYIEDEFEELAEATRSGVPRHRHLVLLKAVPLGFIAWVTDVISIFTHLSK